jgi:hypothetical protein
VIARYRALVGRSLLLVQQEYLRVVKLLPEYGATFFNCQVIPLVMVWLPCQQRVCIGCVHQLCRFPSGKSDASVGSCEGMVARGGGDGSPLLPGWLMDVTLPIALEGHEGVKTADVLVAINGSGLLTRPKPPSHAQLDDLLKAQRDGNTAAVAVITAEKQWLLHNVQHIEVCTAVCPLPFHPHAQMTVWCPSGVGRQEISPRIHVSCPRSGDSDHLRAENAAVPRDCKCVAHVRVQLVGAA